MPKPAKAAFIISLKDSRVYILDFVAGNLVAYKYFIFSILRNILTVTRQQKPDESPKET
jgi:hypothetical protein